MFSLLPAAIALLSSGASLDQVVLAMDRPDPALEGRVKACTTESSIKELAAREDIVIMHRISESDSVFALGSRRSNLCHRTWA